MCVLTLNHSPCDSGGTVEDTIVEFLCLGHMCAIREKLCLIETTGISNKIECNSGDFNVCHVLL